MNYCKDGMTLFWPFHDAVGWIIIVNDETVRLQKLSCHSPGRTEETYEVAVCYYNILSWNSCVKD